MNKFFDFIYKNFNLNNKFFISIFISFIVIIIVLAFMAWLFWDVFIRLNLSLQNELYNQRTTQTVNHKPFITTVEIDDKTLQDSKKWWLWRWQDFKRMYYAKVLDRLKDDWAVVIWLDVLFSEEQDKINDSALKDSIKNAWNVILAFQNLSWIYPLDDLTNSAAWIWDVMPTLNKFNNMVYSIKPFLLSSWKLVKSFSFAVMDEYYKDIFWGESSSLSYDDTQKNYIDFHDIKIPYLKNNYEFYINYSPINNVFNKISFVDVYNWNYDKNLIKDKIVLIWATALWLHDEFNTPFWIIPWVYIHAKAINTVLNKKVIFFIEFKNELLILVLFIFLITLLWVNDIFWNLHKFYFITSLFFLSVVYFKIYNYIFLTYDTIFQFPVFFFIAIFLSFIFVSLYRYVYEDKWKRILKDALSQYLAKDLVDAVLNDYKKIDLNGDKKNITIFFSDIAWFTTLSENLEPHELMDFLKKYLKEVTDVIINNKWFINKYEWDAVMALWWTFSSEKYQSYNTCKAALEQQKVINTIKDELKEKYDFDLIVRMWINKGEAIIWNIWSLWNKIEYTAIWDAVNIASRLESINKVYWTKICVSESVINDLKDLMADNYLSEFVFRKLDIIKVKWKKKSVAIYELIWYRSDISDEILDSIKRFESGLELYFKKDFVKAKEIFLKNITDNVSDIFLKRCENFINNPIFDEEMIWQFEHK